MQLTDEQKKKIAVENIQQCEMTTMIDDVELKYGEAGLVIEGKVPAGTLIIHIDKMNYGLSDPFWTSFRTLIHEYHIEDPTHITKSQTPEMPPPPLWINYNGRHSSSLYISDEKIIRELAEAGLKFPGSDIWLPPKQKSHAEAIR